MENPKSTKNFEKYPEKRIDTLGLAYDITSIMHYTHEQAAKSGLSALEPVDKKVLMIDNYYPMILSYPRKKNATLGKFEQNGPLLDQKSTFWAKLWLEGHKFQT